jgi:hypothetical protein
MRFTRPGADATTSGSRDIVATPHIHVTDNAVMNSLLLRACFDHAVGHFLFFSCSVMYQPREAPWREDEWDASQEMHLNYFGIGWTKVYIEKMCAFFGRLGRTRHTVIRHTNVFGPHDKFDLERSHVFGATVTKAMTSTTGAVTVWGSGPSDVWAFGSRGGRRFDGANWSSVSEASGSRVWGRSASDVWLVGGSQVGHFDGKAWTPVGIRVDQGLTGVWGSASGDVWVIGARGAILRKR